MPGSLHFNDYLTLQSSLILLPADDEDCIGAVLSALIEREEEEEKEEEKEKEKEKE
eukprot:CAMPEP_0118654036 /NCGR_PEP_ID=MMETSP0785-20121206/12152_1 /TAXON_ID=91992 /ORGANISM="Bolidomonas pacifica, Strain CCMP 1866" /LENGTH=55 /DNA_ID=CAMNT_0006546623 /DNA_START=141 /DNA_END=305 /DNA_ORIENTATION=+